MNSTFVSSFKSEWLKAKGSLALWIVIIGGFFTPAIVTVVRIIHYKSLPALYATDNFWTVLWQNSWESMSIFLLPLGVILTTSLITQIEYKNNTWKQLHTLPLRFTTIFFSKFALVIVMLVGFFALFNIGIFLSAIVPYLLVSGVPFPKAEIPVRLFITQDCYYFIDCLPIVSLQYLLSLKYKNFLVPVGIGFLIWIAALAALSWKYGYLVPYTYCMFTYVNGGVASKAIVPSFNFHLVAIAYSILFTLISYVLYLNKKEKG